MSSVLELKAAVAGVFGMVGGVTAGLFGICLMRFAKALEAVGGDDKGDVFALVATIPGNSPPSGESLVLPEPWAAVAAVATAFPAAS